MAGKKKGLIIFIMIMIAALYFSFKAFDPRINTVYYEDQNEKIQEEIRAGLSKKEAIKKLDEQCLNVFKDRLGTLTTIALYIPTLAVSNKVFPMIAERMTKNEDK